MKVLHITTSIAGGAGIAALRSHISLLNEGIDSRILYLGSDVNNNPSEFSLPYFEPSLIQKIGHKLGLNPCAIYKQINASKITRSQGIEIYSLPFSDYALHNHPLVTWADIIHLHWVTGIIDYPTFFSKTQKPLVWTLHDMNPFMGGFHYKEGYNSATDDIKSMENRLTTLKAEILQINPFIHIVCPSRWICNLSQNSAAFVGKPHHIIPNTIDTNTYVPLDKSNARCELRIPNNLTLLLFSAASISNKRKGFDLLLEAFSVLPEHTKRNLGLCIVGSKHPTIDINIKTYFLGKISDEHCLSKAYSAADAFIITSREDNLPNVIIESLICGTPVIGTPVGGIPEMIQSQRNGILSRSTSPEDIAAAIESFIHHKTMFDLSNIRNEALTRYNPQTHSMSLLNLYRSINII